MRPRRPNGRTPDDVGLECIPGHRTTMLSGMESYATIPESFQALSEILLYGT